MDNTSPARPTAHLLIAGFFPHLIMCENLVAPTLMNRDKEIHAVASIYIRDHGEDAVIHAAMRADALYDAGDMEGQNVWLRVR